MWQQVYSGKIAQLANPAPIYYTFSKPLIVVSASCSTAKPSWRKAGLATPIFTIPDIGLVRGFARLVNLDTQLIEFAHAAGLSYSIEFYLYGWISDVDLIFWQS